MTTTNCPNHDRLIGYALDDGITAAEHAAVEQHLPACAACRREVAALRASLGLVASRVDNAPVPDLRDRVLTQLANQQRLAFFPRRAWLPALAAAGLLFALVGYHAWQAPVTDAPVVTASVTATPVATVTTVTTAVARDIEFTNEELNELFDAEERALWQEMDDLSLAMTEEPVPDELDEV